MSLRSRVLLLFRMRASSALDAAEDPRQVLDYAYLQQQELLRKVKQGLIEVATSKHQLEHQSSRLREQATRMDEQARRALEVGREDLARVALLRKQTALAQIDDLDRQFAEVAGDERKLIAAEQQLSLRVEDFRSHRQLVTARYTAAEAQVRITEMLSGVSDDLAELSMAVGRAEEKTERMRARAAAIDALMGESLTMPLGGQDQVERELRRVSAERAVDDELARLKAEQASGDQVDQSEATA